MEIVSSPECQEWLKVNLGKSFTSVKDNYPNVATYAIPIDTGQKTALARIVSHDVGAGLGGLLWITAWGVFPSSQNMELFDGYRKSLGEKRAVHDVPGHIFIESDLQQIECLFSLALYFFWDAIIFDKAGTVAVEISHDEFLSIGARDIARLRQFQSTINGLKLKQLV